MKTFLDFSCRQTLLLISRFRNLLELRICKLGYENGDWFQDFIILRYTENAELTQNVDKKTKVVNSGYLTNWTRFTKNLIRSTL